MVAHVVVSYLGTDRYAHFFGLSSRNAERHGIVTPVPMANWSVPGQLIRTGVTGGGWIFSIRQKNSRSCLDPDQGNGQPLLIEPRLEIKMQ